MTTYADELNAALAGSYRIERELGGGMSRVFVARDEALGREVVIKVIKADGGEDEWPMGGNVTAISLSALAHRVRGI